MSRARWFAHPLGSFGLLMVWMLLVDDFSSVGHWLLVEIPVCVYLAYADRHHRGEFSGGAFSF